MGEKFGFQAPEMPWAAPCKAPGPRRDLVRSGMMPECLRRRDLRMPTVFLGSDRAAGCTAYLAILKPGSWSWSEWKENSLRCLRASAEGVLRPQAAVCARPLVWGYAGISGGRSPGRGGGGVGGWVWG